MQLLRLIHTIRYLQFRQVFYRVWYTGKNKHHSTAPYYTVPIPPAKDFPTIAFFKLPFAGSYDPVTNEYCFLNKTKKNEGKPDWDHSEFGKLWLYHLNYFEYLRDDSIPVKNRNRLINLFLSSNKKETALDPYPTSLRAIEWIKFLSSNGKFSLETQAQLYNDYCYLTDYPEYNISGNHLLENGFSLLFGAHYLNNSRFHAAAKKILYAELKAQILEDGAHYEKSPAYHTRLLGQLLSCIELVRGSGRFVEDAKGKQQRESTHPHPSEEGSRESKSANYTHDVQLQNETFEKMLVHHASLMLGWADSFAFKDGSMAMFGDSAPENVIPVETLKEYAAKLDIKFVPAILNDSGYRRLEGKNWEMVINSGMVTAPHQPGHIHADAGTFCVQWKGKPLIVDTGVSTYEDNERRRYERGTAAHNTIAIDSTNSSEVWASFRMGRRVKPVVATENNKITVSYSPYLYKRMTHERKFTGKENKIIITDSLMGVKPNKAFLHLHFHPSVEIVDEGNFGYRANGAQLTLKGIKEAYLEEYLFARGFNDLVPAKRIRAAVEGYAETEIDLTC